MFSMVNATIDGLATIQLIPDARQALADEFDALQNANISARFLFFALTRALSFWIEIICLIYMTTVAVVFVTMEGCKCDGRETQFQSNNKAVENNSRVSNRFLRRHRWPRHHTDPLSEHDVAVGHQMHGRLGKSHGIGGADLRVRGH